MTTPPKPDVIEAGTGALSRALLIHSSVSGARQWRSLMDALAPDWHSIAVNLYGYGSTPPWPDDRAQTLTDQARLVASAIPDDTRPIAIVGHSFGASVAMKSAALLGPRVSHLVLIEPNPFYLLRQQGRLDAFAEAVALRDVVLRGAHTKDMMPAAAYFADYWTGNGAWDAMPTDRQEKFASALAANVHEWAAVMDETTSAAEWARDLPSATTVITARDTVRTICEIAEILAAHAPNWQFETLDRGGHMAPLTAPDLVNPLIRRALG